MKLCSVREFQVVDLTKHNTTPLTEADINKLSMQVLPSLDSLFFYKPSSEHL
jgi:hypothetical protein